MKRNSKQMTYKAIFICDEFEKFSGLAAYFFHLLSL